MYSQFLTDGVSLDKELMTARIMSNINFLQCPIVPKMFSSFITNKCDHEGLSRQIHFSADQTEIRSGFVKLIGKTNKKEKWCRI